MKSPQSTVAKETLSSSSHNYVWTVKQSAAQAKIIALLQFAACYVPIHATESLLSATSNSSLIL